MPVVWATRIPIDHRTRRPLDVQAANQFGKVCPIFPKTVGPYDIRKQVTIIEEDVLPVATDDDYLLVVGPRTMLTVFTAAWVRHFDSMRLLVYDRLKKEYVPRIALPPARK